MGEEIERK